MVWENYDLPFFVGGSLSQCLQSCIRVSPSCAEGVDSAWDAWRKHVRINMKVPDEEQTMWDTWQPQILEKLIERHKKVNAHLKAKQAQEGVRNFSPR